MMAVKRIAEFDEEPEFGLPARLPEGERLLWQGRPNWRVMALRALHLRKLAIYFTALLAYVLASKLSSGEAPSAVLRSFAQFAGVAGALLGMIVLYAWGASRAAVYTITDRRLVMRFGLVVPVSFNIPFGKIASAGLKTYPDGAGDVAITLEASERIGYFILWPHARPWRMKHAEPALRCIDGAEQVASILARALAGAAAQPIPVRVAAKAPAGPAEAALA